MARRYAARIDRNQPEIIDRFEALGCSVIPLHTVGDGVCDLLIGLKVPTVGAFTFLAEVKDGNKPPSARPLTPDQVRFFRTFRGAAVVILSADEAEHVVISLRRGDFGVIHRAPYSERLPADGFDV